MRKIARIGRKSKRKYRKMAKVISSEEYGELGVDSRVELIQALIPLALMKVEEELETEVMALAGERYARTGPVRYGKNPGSVVLGGQRVGVSVPRVRDRAGGEEIPLASYRRLHHGKDCDDASLIRVLKGLSCRDYEAAAMAVPEAFGLSSSSVSRRFVRASGKQLKALQNRDLSTHNIVVIVLDGKTFSKDDLIVALGVTLEGSKVVLGFVEASTENERVTSEFLRGLLSRGLNIDEGVLVVVDGSKGLLAGIRKALAGRVLIHRCNWHKRENVVSYVSKEEQPVLRKRLQRAYDRPTYDESKRELMKIRRDLEDRNQSAVGSLDEGFEETLTLHRLGVFPLVGKSLKTTNCMESVNALIEQRCGKVDNWKSSSQRQRWLASTLLDIEPRLNRIAGYRHLHKLRAALKKELKLNEKKMKKAA
ncbi:MAG: transposase [Pseudomonadota bacterium]